MSHTYELERDAEIEPMIWVSLFFMITGFLTSIAMLLKGIRRISRGDPQWGKPMGPFGAAITTLFSVLTVVGMNKIFTQDLESDTAYDGHEMMHQAA
jgi:hypothetical protein